MYKFEYLHQRKCSIICLKQIFIIPEANLKKENRFLSLSRGIVCILKMELLYKECKSIAHDLTIEMLWKWRKRTSWLGIKVSITDRIELLFCGIEISFIHNSNGKVSASNEDLYNTMYM